MQEYPRARWTQVGRVVSHFLVAAWHGELLNYPRAIAKETSELQAETGRQSRRYA